MGYQCLQLLSYLLPHLTWQWQNLELALPCLYSIGHMPGLYAGRYGLTTARGYFSLYCRVLFLHILDHEEPVLPYHAVPETLLFSGNQTFPTLDRYIHVYIMLLLSGRYLSSL